MQFDLFHSVGRIDTIEPRLECRQVFTQFFEQACLAEELGFSTVWAAESHFSSEVQKAHKDCVIPNYHGEVGLNNDSILLAERLFGMTSRIGFGTAIFNIVGGNGGPIAAADRIRALAYFNTMRTAPRQLHIGVASGRFAYINKPFGIVPRTAVEELLWPMYQRLIFVEALEIFLRLSQGETLSSDDTSAHTIHSDDVNDPQKWTKALQLDGAPAGRNSLPYQKRWLFESLKLVPELTAAEVAAHVRFVLGSSDPLARDVGLRFADLDIFNLSFTPPDKINTTHDAMHSLCHKLGRTWHRRRMPRTVLVFIDNDPRRARAHAERCFDVYIEAMRGTVQLPPKEALMQRALIGDPAMIRDQLNPEDPHGFHRDDRLMLWFEFNQSDHREISQQMRLFAEQVMPHYAD